jgi:protein TonB
VVGRAAAAPRADNPKPVYPAYARRRGIEGRVVLGVEVTAEGNASAVAVVESSGHDSLDAAALKVVRQWRFDPAVRDGGVVPSRVQVPILFRLTE